MRTSDKLAGAPPDRQVASLVIGHSLAARSYDALTLTSILSLWGEEEGRVQTGYIGNG